MKTPSTSPIEHTLVLIKPDAIEQDLHLTILHRLEHACKGTCIKASRILRFSPELCKQHYSHIAHEAFYPRIEDYMCSSDVWAAVLEGPQGMIQGVRQEIGATDPTKAAEKTIRKTYGKIITENGEKLIRNVVHGSENQAEAYEEIRRLFLREEIENTMPELARILWPADA